MQKCPISSIFYTNLKQTFICRLVGMVRYKAFFSQVLLCSTFMLYNHTSSESLTPINMMSLLDFVLVSHSYENRETRYPRSVNFLLHVHNVLMWLTLTLINTLRMLCYITLKLMPHPHLTWMRTCR